jgi:hypothetical protein
MSVSYLFLILVLCTTAMGAVLPSGETLPKLEGEYLSGRKAILPVHSQGKWAMLAIGFTYDSRFAVEEWTKLFREATKGRQDTTFYEIPMIGGMARMGKWFIDSGMRRGTPKDLHENVITVYGGTDAWKQRMGFKEPDHAYVVLIDPKGVVRWVGHSGSSAGFDQMIRNLPAAQ